VRFDFRLPKLVTFGDLDVLERTADLRYDELDRISPQDVPQSFLRKEPLATCLNITFIVGEAFKWETGDYRWWRHRRLQRS
jgi:hypothetical protein